MAREFTDISDLLKKVNNEEAASEIEASAVPEEEYLSADEFVNKVVKPIQELQHDSRTNVKAVKFNNVTYEPDEEGTVTFNQMVDQDTYAVRLATDVSSEGTIVKKTGSSIPVNLRYMAIRITTAGDRINYQSVPGTLTIDRSFDGGEYENVLTQGNITSSSENSHDYPIALELGQYCLTGSNTIRIRVSTYYFDENNVRRDIYGETFYQVTAVNLGVKNMANWSQQILASNGMFPLSFAVYGAVEKWLHVQISGSKGTLTQVIRFAANQENPESNPYTWSEQENPTYGILSHGVHAVTAWVSCDDGSGSTGADGYYNGLESDKIISRFMVVNTSASTEALHKPFLMLQQVVTEAANYVRTEICKYAVWIPSATNPEVASLDPLAISIRLTDAADNDTDYMQEFYRSELKVQSSTAYTLDTAIEIENTQQGEAPKEYSAYLRIFRYDDNEDPINFMRESSNIRYQLITIDNSQDFSPVAGAHFFLNPKVRNNSEANWKRIVNQVTGQIIPSTWSSNFGGVIDAWIDDGTGQKVLRTLAGQTINIEYEPWEQFKTNASSLMSLEINFAVRNITAEEDPALDICQAIGQAGQLLGLRMKPLTAFLMAQQHQVENDQDWGFEEGKRTHCVIVLNPQVIAKADDELTWQSQDAAMSPLALAKIYINGYINRELDYPVTSGAWITGAGHGGIKLGCPSADLDIYGIRCYRGIALSAQNVVQNYIASLPTADEKVAVRNANDILDGYGRISYAKVKAKGKRCLTLFGQDNYKLNQDKKKGYPCYWRIDYFDDNGNYIPELSGTICKASYEAFVAGTLGGKKPMYNTAQGSTANTYWDNNEQTKLDKVTYVINVLFSSLHSDFGWKAEMSTPDGEGKCSNPMYFDGSQITPSDYANLTTAQQERVTIDVIDGWIDGNGKYHGQCYTSALGAPLATKLVNKINYASPMQSHKMGATRLYNDVMKAVTGGMALHQTNSKARFAVLEDSFFFFTAHPDDNFKVEYRGLSTFGSGKCDKPTWGYPTNKNAFVFEGANNNLPLCDFRVPADDDVVYDPSEEAWCYNGVESMDYDLGKTESRLDGEGKVIMLDDEAAEFPTQKNEAIFRKYCNFIYTHGTALEYFRGSRTQFEQKYAALVAAMSHDSPTYDPDASEQVADMQKKKYWFSEGSEQFHLVRYDYVRTKWVDAGTFDLNGTNYYTAGAVDLSQDGMTAQAYQDWYNSDDRGDYVKLNKVFRYAIARHAAANFSLVGHAGSHKVHYNLVNFFIAGTDNCSKNTYYHADPNTGLIWLDQDDMDTIFKTDNNGRQTKVYFLDRINDVSDYAAGYKPQIDFEGRASNLFNLIEVMWEELSDELRANMRQILTAMAGLVSASDSIPDVSEKVSAWGCLHKYFFSIQKYFPQVAYNEQARLRYEYPKSFGYISRGNQSRGIDPITQSVGNQLESEVQYMKRRLALIASYACWGDFSSGVNTGVVGLEDSGSSFNVSPGSGRTGGNYVFDVVPHQFLYPTGMADRRAIDPHVRVAPGQHYQFTVATTGEISGDSSVGLAALNYYREIGNVGNMVVGNNSLNLNGSRLTKFIAEPSAGASQFFAPKAIVFTGVPNVEQISMNGSASIYGTLDFSIQARMQTLDLRGTNVSNIVLPQSSAITSVKLGTAMTSINANNLPNLSELTVGNVGDTAPAQHIVSIRIMDCPLVSSQNIVTAAWQSNNEVLDTISVNKIDWSNVASALLQWVTGIQNTDMAGKIAVTSTEIVNAALKLALLNKFGAIDEQTNKLYITYLTRAVVQMRIVTQRFIIQAPGSYPYKVSIFPSQANTFKKIAWSLSANTVGATVDANTGVLTVPNLGSEAANTVAQLTCTVTLLDNTTMSDTINLKLFNRLPKVGDFAYADGEFDAELYYGKNVVGMVYKVTDYDNLTADERARHFEENTEWQTAYENGQKLYEVLVEYKSNVSYKTYDGATTFSSTPWGIFPSNSGGITAAERESIATAVTNAGYAMTAVQVADIPTIANNTTHGLPKADGTGVQFSVRDFSAYDDNQDDGFMVYPSASSPADWNGKQKTKLIVEHANKILSAYVINMVDANGRTIWDELGNPDHIIPENNTELADLLVALANIGGSPRWRQVAYPAAYSCYLMEPEADDLHDQYKRGCWYLPGEADKIRLYIFFRNSRALTPKDTGTPTAAYSDEDNAERAPEQTEARKPIYANALKRSADKALTCPIAMPTQSDTWSSTEYGGSNVWYINFRDGYVHATTYDSKNGSLVVRPVAAFTFEL